MWECTFYQWQGKGAGNVMPMKPARPCRYRGCAGLTTDSSGYCEQHKNTDRKRRARDYSKKPDDKFYSSTAWAKCRLMKLARDPLCEDCLAEGRLTQGEIVHHVIHYQDRPDMAYHLDNLRTVCRSCHAKEHLYENNFLKK